MKIDGLKTFVCIRISDKSGKPTYCDCYLRVYAPSDVTLKHNDIITTDKGARVVVLFEEE